MAQTLDFKTAVSMLDDPVNCFHSVTKDRHLTLPPRCFGKVKEGIKEQLDKDISVYSDRYLNQKNTSLIAIPV